MKKVYTITFHNVNNYGAVLQAYALQNILKKKYDTKILNYENHIITNPYKLFRKDTRNILKIIFHFLKKFPHYISESKRIYNFDKFRSKLILTEHYDKLDDFYKIANNVYAVITGSDQVWNSNISFGLDRNYFLDYDNVKKISYAASCGSINVLEKNLRGIEIIKKIDHISVREKELEMFLNSKLGKSIKTVIDPTLLLTKKDWEQLNIKNRIIKEKYIFAYSVSNETEEYINFINSIASFTGLKVIFFDKKNKNLHCNKKSYFTAGPEEFLNLLNNSEFVITTSFHGVALSSVLNKKMYIFLSTHPERITTLTSIIGIENRIMNNKKFTPDMLNDDVNWNNVNEKIKEIRKDSLEWLQNAIDN